MALLFNSLMLDAMSIILTLITVLYFYVIRNFNYWEKKGVHTIRPTPFFGSIANVLLLRENIGCWLARAYKEMACKRLFGIYLIDKPALVVRDLEVVKYVLVKDAHCFLDRTFPAREDLDPLLAKNLLGLGGKRWRHLRTKLSPTFTSGKMKKMFCFVDECGKQLAMCLEQNVSSGAYKNVMEVMSRYSTDVIAACAFGVDTNAQRDPKCEFHAALKTISELDSLPKKIGGVLVFLMPRLVRLFGLKTINADVENLVRKMFWDIVQQRRNTGVTRNDFVDLMMNIIDEGEVRPEDKNDLEELKLYYSYNKTECSKEGDTKFEMKGDDFVAQAFVFLVAAFETSSLVLSYTLYELALNLDIQEKLRNEIMTAFDKHEGNMLYENLANMKYLEMVVTESLRKYPPLAFLDRTCSSTYKIPGTEVTIEKGTQVIIPVLGIHSDPAVYPDPEKYEPERFSAENKSNRFQCSYLSFGDGPRICLGMRFGHMQVKTALIHVLRSFQVLPCAETPTPPLQFKPAAVMHIPKEDIVLTFKKL